MVEALPPPGLFADQARLAQNLQMLGYAISNWYTPNRNNALDILEQEEERWNEHSGVSGLDSDEDEINGQEEGFMQGYLEAFQRD